MALIKCPECGNDISNKAEVCPKCGLNIQKLDNLKELSNKKAEEISHKKSQNINYIMAITIPIAVILIVIACSTFSDYKQNKEIEERKEGIKENEERQEELRKEIDYIEGVIEDYKKYN